MSDLTNFDSMQCQFCGTFLRPGISSSSSKGNLICKNCFPSPTYILTPATLQEKMPSNENKSDCTQRHCSDNTENETTQNKFCPFRNLGCELRLNGTDIGNHEFDCPFSCMNFCSYLGITECSHKTASADLLEHLESKHLIKSLRASVETPARFHQLGELRYRSRIGNLRWSPICIIYDGIRFVFRTTLINRAAISWSIFVLGSNETAERFNAAITIESQQDTSLRWKGQVFPINESNYTSRSFTLPIVKLKEFASPSKHSDSDIWNILVELQDKSTEYPSSSKKIPIARNQACPLKRKSGYTENEDGIPQHRGFLCDSCSMNPIVGTRYRCMACKDYDLCQTCMDMDTNSHADHIFLRIPKYDNATWNFKSLTTCFHSGQLTFEMDSEQEDESSDSDSDADHANDAVQDQTE